MNLKIINYYIINLIYSLVTPCKCLFVTKMKKKNVKKSMFIATNFDYSVCNGIEIIATYFLLSA